MEAKEQKRTTLGKKAMIAALEQTLGIVTDALKISGITRTTHYEWLKEDPEYAAEVNSVGEMALDFAESHLHKQISEGEVSSTIFFLKTKGKKRGYVERQEITGADGNPLQVQQITGMEIT